MKVPRPRKRSVWKLLTKKRYSFALTKPCAYFLDLLTGAKPVREDKWEEWGSTYGSSHDKIVMNGPFLIDSWDQNVQMTLVKNEDYWDAANVKLDVIERKVIREPATAVQALLSGQIDVVGTNDPEWRQVIEAEGDKFRMIQMPDNAPEFLGFNCNNKYFKNPKIRIAFSLGFDREKYIEDLRYGLSEPLYSLIPSVINCGDMPYKERVGGRNEIVKELTEQYPDPRALLVEGLGEEGFDPDPSKMDVKYATRGTAEYSKRALSGCSNNMKRFLVSKYYHRYDGMEYYVGESRPERLRYLHRRMGTVL